MVGGQWHAAHIEEKVIHYYTAERIQVIPNAHTKMAAHSLWAGLAVTRKWNTAMILPTTYTA